MSKQPLPAQPLPFKSAAITGPLWEKGHEPLALRPEGPLAPPRKASQWPWVSPNSTRNCWTSACLLGHQGFPGGTAVKNPPAGDTGDAGSIPGSGRSPPAPVFMPGESHGQRSLAGYCPWGHKNRTESPHTHTHTHTGTAGSWAACPTCLRLPVPAVRELPELRVTHGGGDMDFDVGLALSCRQVVGGRVLCGPLLIYLGNCDPRGSLCVSLGSGRGSG